MMKRTVPVFFAAVLLLAAPAAGADTAERPSEGALWTGAGLSAAAGQSGWGVSGPLQHIGLGFELEYGLIPWASVQAQWRPAVLLSGYSRSGSTGHLGDVQIGARFGILGEKDSLISLGFLRLTFAAGLKAPLPPGTGTAWEPDTHLWGAKVGLSCDYLAAPWFHLNLGAAALLSPEQASQNPNFTPRLRSVEHPLDLSIELEPRFRVLNPSGVIFSLPLVYEYSAETRIRETALGDGRHFLSLGIGYTMVIRNAALPFEVGMRCFMPLYGVNQIRLQRMEFTGKIEIPLFGAGKEAEESEG
jgi:hypothetical protein